MATPCAANPATASAAGVCHTPIAEGKTTLISTGTDSGKTECFLYPIVTQALTLRDDHAWPRISAVIVYPMNALAEDQLMRLRGLLAGTGIPFKHPHWAHARATSGRRRASTSGRVVACCVRGALSARPARR